MIRNNVTRLHFVGKRSNPEATLAGVYHLVKWKFCHSVTELWFEPFQRAPVVFWSVEVAIQAGIVRFTQGGWKLNQKLFKGAAP